MREGGGGVAQAIGQKPIVREASDVFLTVRNILQYFSKFGIAEIAYSKVLQTNCMCSYTSRFFILFVLVLESVHKFMKRGLLI